MPPKPSVLFFGCHDRPGHSAWTPGWCRDWYVTRSCHLDGWWAPYQIAPDLITWQAGHDQRDWNLRVLPRTECEQGRYLLHSWRGSTLMAWWDRQQGDTRPGSNSALIVPGTRTAEEMIAALAEHFPSVLENLARAGVELREVGS